MCKEVGLIMVSQALISSSTSSKSHAANRLTHLALTHIAFKGNTGFKLLMDILNPCTNKPTKLI